MIYQKKYSNEELSKIKLDILPNYGGIAYGTIKKKTRRERTARNVKKLLYKANIRRERNRNSYRNFINDLSESLNYYFNADRFFEEKPKEYSA